MPTATEVAPVVPSSRLRTTLRSVLNHSTLHRRGAKAGPLDGDVGNETQDELAHAFDVGREEALYVLDRHRLDVGVALEPRLATRVATAFGHNVRRLEGALNRLVGHARLSGRPIDEELALEVLGELRPRPPSPLTVEDVLAATAENFHTTARRLRGRKRSAALLLPRRVAMYLARELLGRPFAELGTAFGRDHTTVMQAWRAIAARRQTDRALAAALERIRQRLGAGTS